MLTEIAGVLSEGGKLSAGEGQARPAGPGANPDLTPTTPPSAAAASASAGGPSAARRGGCR